MKDRTLLYAIALVLALAAAVGFLLWLGFDDLGAVREADSVEDTSPAASEVKPDSTARPLEADPTATTSSKPPVATQPPVAPEPPPTPGFGRRGGREGLDPPPPPPPQ